MQVSNKTCAGIRLYLNKRGRFLHEKERYGSFDEATHSKEKEVSERFLVPEKKATTGLPIIVFTFLLSSFDETVAGANVENEVIPQNHIPSLMEKAFLRSLGETIVNIMSSHGEFSGKLRHDFFSKYF